MIAFFYVQRNLVRRLSATCDSMRRLSAGDRRRRLPAVRDATRSARWRARYRCSAMPRSRRSGWRRRRREDRSGAEEERARSDAARAEAARQVAQVVDGLGRGLERLAQGDLTYRVRDDWAERVPKIQDDFNGAIDQLQETLTAIVELTREVSSASPEISSSTTDLSQRTEEQAANLEQTSASMEEISATVRKNAESAQHANGSDARDPRRCRPRRRSGVAGGLGDVADRGFIAQDFRHHFGDRRDCAPDQSAGAECGGGSRARRRGRPRLCGGGRRGAQSRAAFVAGRQGHQGSDLQFVERRSGRACSSSTAPASR